VRRVTPRFKLIGRRPPSVVRRNERLPLSGTMITRQYKGETLQIEVLPQGFSYQGDVYKSLSAVAGAITGQHCNGFHFFRLGKEAAQ
jgi:Protein of unknown function (DUF2924)